MVNGLLWVQVSHDQVIPARLVELSCQSERLTFLLPLPRVFLVP